MKYGDLFAAKHVSYDHERLFIALDRFKCACGCDLMMTICVEVADFSGRVYHVADEYWTCRVVSEA